MIIPADGRVDVLMPHAKRMVHNGVDYVVVPHKLDETKVLKNLGYDVRPPIMVNYAWPGPSPFDSQRITAALITMNDRSFVLNGIGTGKTRSFLYAFAHMKDEGKVHRACVVCPLSTVRQTWAKEVLMVFPHLKVRVLTGDKARRLRLLAEDADVYIINHDGVEVIAAELFARTDIDMICLDELSVYKEAKAERWKIADKLVNSVPGRFVRVVGMTATPVPKAPTDCYAQTKLINPAAIPERYTRFREKVMYKITNFKWVSHKDAIDTVHRTMQPAVRFTRDECYDLPPCQIVMREAQLTPQQNSLYQKMAQECAAQVAQGDVKAVNAADQLNKLAQIALGAVYTTDREVVELPCGPRLSVLDDAVDESNSKVIVFTPYKHSLRVIAEHLRKRYAVDVISGDTPPSQREATFHNFMNATDPHVIVAHPRCMSHGLTLTAASTIVWFGPPLSLEEYEQANGRITRAGQRHAQLVINIAATRLEQRIYERLEKRAEIQSLLLDLYEAQELGELM
jgi:SNF2 family DNA or RNA helicase